MKKQRAVAAPRKRGAAENKSKRADLFGPPAYFGKNENYKYPHAAIKRCRFKPPALADTYNERGEYFYRFMHYSRESAILQADKRKTVNLYKSPRLYATERRLYLYRGLFTLTIPRCENNCTRGAESRLRIRAIRRGIKKRAVLIDKRAYIIYNKYL